MAQRSSDIQNGNWEFAGSWMLRPKELNLAKTFRDVAGGGGG